MLLNNEMIKIKDSTKGREVHPVALQRGLRQVIRVRITANLSNKLLFYQWFRFNKRKMILFVYFKKYFHLRCIGPIQNIPEIVHR